MSADGENLAILEQYAIITHREGLETETRKACLAIINFVEGDGSGLGESMIYSSDFILSLAYALLNDREHAIEHFSHLDEAKVNELWMVEMRESLGVFDNIKADPAYIETVENLQHANAKTLVRLREEVPEAFIGSI